MRLVTAIILVVLSLSAIDAKRKKQSAADSAPSYSGVPTIPVLPQLLTNGSMVPSIAFTLGFGQAAWGTPKGWSAIPGSGKFTQVVMGFISYYGIDSNQNIWSVNAMDAKSTWTQQTVPTGTKGWFTNAMGIYGYLQKNGTVTVILDPSVVTQVGIPVPSGIDLSAFAGQVNFYGVNATKVIANPLANILALSTSGKLWGSSFLDMTIFGQFSTVAGTHGFINGTNMTWWTQIPWLTNSSVPTQIACDINGNPWIVDQKGNIFTPSAATPANFQNQTNVTWQWVANASNILSFSVGYDGSLWITRTAPAIPTTVTKGGKTTTTYTPQSCASIVSTWNFATKSWYDWDCSNSDNGGISVSAIDSFYASKIDTKYQFFILDIHGMQLWAVQNLATVITMIQPLLAMAGISMPSA